MPPPAIPSDPPLPDPPAGLTGSFRARKVRVKPGDRPAALQAAKVANVGPPLLDEIYQFVKLYNWRDYPERRPALGLLAPQPAPLPADQTQALAAAVCQGPRDAPLLLRYAADQVGRGLPQLARLILTAAAPVADAPQLAQIAHLCQNSSKST